MLREIAIITIVVSNLAEVQTGWQEELGYTIAARGPVSGELSRLWQAEAMAGLDSVILRPASEAPVYIRFVADEAAADYRAMTTHGWNAVELLVEDPDALAAQLADSSFTVVNQPRDLWNSPNAPRAFQALGPGGEMLYLTTNIAASTVLGIADDMPFVDRAFITIVGGPSMADFRSFYSGRLGLQMGDPMSFRLSTFSKLSGRDPEAAYPIATVSTAPGYMIETDELPADLPARATVDGHLPPGIAIVGFAGKEGEYEVEWHSAPRALTEFPYVGRRAGILTGPAGELIEVVFDAD